MLFRIKLHFIRSHPQRPLNCQTISSFPLCSSRSLPSISANSSSLNMAIAWWSATLGSRHIFRCLFSCTPELNTALQFRHRWELLFRVPGRTRRLCVLIWSDRWCDWLNVLLQISHTKGLTPSWSFWCFFRFASWLKRWPHTEHANGFSREWDRKCTCSPLASENTFPHPGFRHLCRFFPVWYFRCFIKDVAHLNRFPQSSHDNGRPFTFRSSPVWLFMCFPKFDLSAKEAPQVRHSCGFFAKWVFMWRRTGFCALNDFPQTSHSIGLFSGGCTFCWWYVNAAWLS